MELSWDKCLQLLYCFCLAPTLRSRHVLLFKNGSKFRVCGVGRYGVPFVNVSCSNSNGHCSLNQKYTEISSTILEANTTPKKPQQPSPAKASKKPTWIMDLTAKELLRKSLSIVGNEEITFTPPKSVWGLLRRSRIICVSRESGGRVAGWSLWRFMAPSPALNCLLLCG